MVQLEVTKLTVKFKACGHFDQSGTVFDKMYHAQWWNVTNHYQVL